MTCVSGIRHFCPRNCLMYVQKTFQCGDFLPFSSLEFSQWMLRMKSVALNDIFYTPAKCSIRACTNWQLLLFKLLREARVPVSAACL